MVVQIKIGDVDHAALRQSARQAAYMQAVAEEAIRLRQSRLKRLNAEENCIKRAVEAYRMLDAGNVPGVRLRRGFVYLEKARPPRGRRPEDDEDVTDALTVADKLRLDIESRPPLTRLIHRRSRNLALLLTGIYVSHLETEPGSRAQNRHCPRPYSRSRHRTSIIVRRACPPADNVNPVGAGSHY